MKGLLLLAAFAVTLTPSAPAAEKRPMTTEDLLKFRRVAGPQISPDGKLVAYQVGTVDMDANKVPTAIWVAATDGKSLPRQLTNPAGKSDRHPRWSPDGKKLLFESNRSGSYQLWVIDLAGGEAIKLTDLSTSAVTGTWSPDGKHIAFVSSVYPEFSELPFAESDKKNKEKMEAAEKSPVKARVFTKLFYRHWDEYIEDKRQHLFVCNADGSDIRDVTPGDRDAYPTSSTFSSSVDFTFTPDGKHLAFTAVPPRNEAWSTNYELCRVGIDNRSPKWETLTTGNEAADSGPQFSPDGKMLAYRAQKTPGYEADKWDILVVDAKPDGTFDGKPQNLTTKYDRSVNDFVWAAGNSQTGPVIYYSADAHGAAVYFAVMVSTGDDFVHHNGYDGQSSSMTVSKDGRVRAFLRASMNAPAEVYTAGNTDAFRLPEKGRADFTIFNVSHANDALLAKLNLPNPVSVEVPVEGGVKMQMWLLRPPGFDPAKKWPVVYLVHGGPQGAWQDGWSYRWNPELWAAQGYVVAMPNPRGSTGFGQKFVDEISGDWGGKCYRDLMAGVDYVEKLPYVDTNRMAAAGASFGGYMMDWFAVNEAAKRFKTLISHCSVWDFESMWGTTDELWFDEWEHKGLPWETPGKYAEFSPHKKAGNLGKYKTPMLLIQNDLDFRCPVGQGQELFSALQRQGVESKLINFPDEGHWVLKPQNSKYWHQEVFKWLKRHVPPGGR